MENREVAVCRLDFEISIATTDVLLVQEISVKKGRVRLNVCPSIFFGRFIITSCQIPTGSRHSLLGNSSAIRFSVRRSITLILCVHIFSSNQNK